MGFWLLSNSRANTGVISRRGRVVVDADECYTSSMVSRQRGPDQLVVAQSRRHGLGLLLSGASTRWVARCDLRWWEDLVSWFQIQAGWAWIWSAWAQIRSSRLKPEEFLCRQRQISHGILPFWIRVWTFFDSIRFLFSFSILRERLMVYIPSAS
jgi:hypothetical protein